MVCGAGAACGFVEGAGVGARRQGAGGVRVEEEGTARLGGRDEGGEGEHLGVVEALIAARVRVAVRGGEGYKDEQFLGGEEGDGAEGRADFFQAFAAKRGRRGLVGFDVTASSSVAARAAIARRQLVAVKGEDERAGAEVGGRQGGGQMKACLVLLRQPGEIARAGEEEDAVSPSSRDCVISCRLRAAHRALVRRGQLVAAHRAVLVALR